MMKVIDKTGSGSVRPITLIVATLSHPCRFPLLTSRLLSARRTKPHYAMNTMSDVLVCVCVCVCVDARIGGARSLDRLAGRKEADRYFPHNMDALAEVKQQVANTLAASGVLAKIKARLACAAALFSRSAGGAPRVGLSCPRDLQKRPG